MIRIFAYNRHSESAKALAAEMGVYLIKHQNSRYRPRQGHTVINWGLGRQWYPARTLNERGNVEDVVNKLRFFQLMQADGRARCPDFTTDIETARSWARDGKKVVVRRVLNGHEGRGIEIRTEEASIPQAPLYTRYVPKAAEYRIHMVAGRIIDSQRKVLRRTVDRDRANFEIRNTANGFVFIREGINVPEDVSVQALTALSASGLDFAAADVIWNERRQQAFVLELNTAPGIVGTTIKKYSQALREYIEQNNQN